MKISLFLLLSSLISSAAPIEEFSRQPYVQMATQDSIRVIWRSESEMKPRVVWGTEVAELSEKVASSQIITRSHPSLGEANPIFKDAPVATRQYEATITGLKPLPTYSISLRTTTSR